MGILDYTMYNQIKSLYEKLGPPMLTNFRIKDLDGNIPFKAGAFTLADQDGRIVLIKRTLDPKHPEFERYWWIPGGGLESGEGIDDAAIREFKEETGLEIRLTKLLVAGLHKNKWFYFFFRGHVSGGELSPYNDPDNTTADARYFLPSELSVQNLWGDVDKIILVKEGFLKYSIDHLVIKCGLKNYKDYT